MRAVGLRMDADEKAAGRKIRPAAKQMELMRSTRA